MRNLSFFSFFCIAFLTLLESCAPALYITNQGYIHGTTYRIVYQHPDAEDIQPAIDTALHAFDWSLSTYLDSSIISRVNRNEAVEVDAYFRTVFDKSREVYEQSDHAFDITIAPLINGWGFGFEKAVEMDSATVDSLRGLVGMEKVRLEGSRVLKTDPRIKLDVDAIAKGYSVDVLGYYLEGRGVTNYLVEIGGEVVARGVNPKGEPWRIGIDKPEDNVAPEDRTLQAIIRLYDVATATSGNYREFYVKDGRKYAHIADPRTGYPVSHNLLSATVIAPDCMTADAWATAFMVLGLERSLEIVENLEKVEAYFIFQNADGLNEVRFTTGFKQYIEKSEAFGVQ